MVLETNIKSILLAINDQDRMHRESLKRVSGGISGSTADSIRSRFEGSKNW